MSLCDNDICRSFGTTSCRYVITTYVVAMRNDNLSSEKRHAVVQKNNILQTGVCNAIVPGRAIYEKQKFFMLLLRRATYGNQSVSMLPLGFEPISSA